MRLIREIGQALTRGDFKTRLTFLVMGFGSAARGQWGRGVLFFAAQVGYLAYMLGFGWRYLADLGTLGTQPQTKVFDKEYTFTRRATTRCRFCCSACCRRC